MSAPKRIQLRRTKGWRKPDGAIVVARPSKWGNPFPVGIPIPRSAWQFALVERHAKITGGITFNGFSSVTINSHQVAVELYDWSLAETPPLMLAVREELAGHDLACWCLLDQPCHADVLLELANAPLVSPKPTQEAPHR